MNIKFIDGLLRLMSFWTMYTSFSAVDGNPQPRYSGSWPMKTHSREKSLYKSENVHILNYTTVGLIVILRGEIGTRTALFPNTLVFPLLIMKQPMFHA